MVIVLNGPLGVGKSETGWQIIRSLRRAAMIDVDFVVAVHPFDHQSDSDVAYAHESAAVLAEHHWQNGFEDLVVNWVFETPAQLGDLRLRFERFGPLAPYRLNCSLESLEQRIRCRGGHEVQREIARARELHGILNQAATTGDLGFVVETDNRSAREAAQTILRHARETAVPSGAV